MNNFIVFALIIIRVFVLPGDELYWIVAHSKDKSFYDGGDFSDKVSAIMEMRLEKYMMKEGEDE